MADRSWRDVWTLRRFHLRVVAGVTVVTFLAVFVSAYAVWRAERGAPRANIRGFGDAVWWAMETITTVGYGDHHPTTTAGRIVAGLLMVAGVALVGVITATVVTWFFSELELTRDVERMEADVARMEQVGEAEERSLQQVVAELQAVNERLDRLERQLEGRRATG